MISLLLKKINALFCGVFYLGLHLTNSLLDVLCFGVSFYSFPSHPLVSTSLFLEGSNQESFRELLRFFEMNLKAVTGLLTGFLLLHPRILQCVKLKPL